MSPDSSSETRPVTLLAIAPSAYLPALLYSIGTGATAPVIALVALGLGASPAQAGGLLALLGVGQIIADVPASAMASAIGERRTMLVAAVVAVALQLTCLLARSLAVLTVAVLIVGMTNAVFLLARQAYLTGVTPLHLRARAMSTLGGSNRIGLLIGPFAGAAAIHLWGERAAFAVAMGAAALTAVLLFVVPDLEVGERRSDLPATRVSYTAVARAHRRLLLTLGTAIVMVGIVRGARSTVLPLWAEHLSVSPAATSLIFGFAAAVEVVVFYPAGKVMDHFGRLAVATPAMAILGAAMIVLPLTAGVTSLATVALTMGLGNGIGSGIMLTLGADTAPPVGRVKFLGIWRVLSDTGAAAGPVLVSLLATVWTLATGIVGVGVVGLLAAGSLMVWAPAFSPYATRRGTRQAREAARAGKQPAPPDNYSHEPPATGPSIGSRPASPETSCPSAPDGPVDRAQTDCRAGESRDPSAPDGPADQAEMPAPVHESRPTQADARPPAPQSGP